MRYCSILAAHTYVQTVSAEDLRPDLDTPYIFMVPRGYEGTDVKWHGTCCSGQLSILSRGCFTIGRPIFLFFSLSSYLTSFDPCCVLVPRSQLCLGRRKGEDVDVCGYSHGVV
jgi:hypothetical protein